MNSFKEYMTPVTTMILAAVILFDHFAPRAVAPTGVTVNGQALGRAYATALVSSYADAWVAAAKVLEEGKSVSESQKTLQDTWKEGRTQAFKTTVEPGFSQVLPEGAEPADPPQRARVAQLWRAFAQGLKRGR